MCAEPRHVGRILPLLAVLLALLVLPGPAEGVMDARTEQALLRIDAVLGLKNLSRDLWPSWDISRTPVVLHCDDGNTYLINHPDPPDGCERLSEVPSMNTDVYRMPPPEHELHGTLSIGGTPTAAVNINDVTRETIPAVFAAAFLAHAAERCPDALETPVLIPPYPVGADKLVLADIEDELLERAVASPKESLFQRACDFAAVRWNRRLRMGGQYGEYERQLEFENGIAAYLAEKCRTDGSEYLDARARAVLDDCLGDPGALERCLGGAGSVEWYRSDRFRWTGALVCCLMDRLVPDWKTQAAAECVDPFELMWRRVRGATPRALHVLARFNYDERVAGRSSDLEDMRTDAELLFDDIMQGSEKLFVICTEQLASAEVRYDPTQVARVDANRRVQQRLFKLECATGTHVHIVGEPVAIVTGDDDFDLRRLVMRAPDEYEIVLDGERFEPVEGVFQFGHSLSVVAEGLEIQAAVGTVMVGHSGLSFILHR